ncbi:hypothetical protein B0T24DRAFT_529456 [Lasiosphaeria ovina]|uniref:Uncharacterized protein n=1 Tax=Lasiosphaeria ovina TaxID=92902 RepID=A0AAE0N7P1_9PEZI|nr:hypothetical protein B0T24DRAFT_529456 [Lasiosphaeria ovina]
MTTERCEPIAIVGSGCRFPGGANSPAALWELLKQPHDVAQNIPPERFDTAGFYHPDGNHHGTGNVRQMYLLQQDLGMFDAQFFFISPAEADAMDPQQRLLLETVYEALEAGGHSLEALRGSDTAVYVGTMGVDYNETIMRDLDTIPTYFGTGTNRAIISNRVSYFFDWHGPSMTIDTACSSSLIAVHQGVQALRTRESRVAVACGTQVILGPEWFIIESKLKMLSPTGRSRMWDADADGYARGEGVAAIVMKRLSDAIADGDHIQCIIRGTGANQDGYSNGLTVPSAVAQAALIRKTYARAGLDLEDLRDRPQYFEAHGTGTKAGDPKEAGAIFECFAKGSASTGPPLYVGSVKTVIGHTEGAAGLAGLLKGVASIQNGLIAPNLLFNRLNPAIETFYQCLKVPTSLTPWPKLPEGVPRRVSINSFGFGGSNAHTILEEYVEPPKATSSESATDISSLETLFTPFIFSAASETSLAAQLQAYSNHLKTHQDTNLVDLAWTLQARRSQFAVKAAFSASSVAELTSKIDANLATAKQNSESIGVRSSSSSSKSGVLTAAPRILGVFTGQGAQWAAMGAQLIKASPGFVAKRIGDLEKSLDTLPSVDRPQWRLRDEMMAGADTSRIGEAELSQPLCTALQIVLVDLLKSAGITFNAVVGHSSGEIGAAYAAGFLSDCDAMRVAYYRGLYARLAGSDERNTNHNSAAKSAGAMLAVGTSLPDAEDLVSLSAFKGRVAVAAHNSSASVTLSGDADAIVLAKKVFDEEKKFARLLKVDKAYHSNHMLPCGDPYMAALRACGVVVRRPETGNDCAWFSSVFPSSQAMEPSEELQGTYWRDNMTKPVLFVDAVNNAVASDSRLSLAVEVGPHPALKGPATQNMSEAGAGTALPYCGVLSRGSNDVEAFSQALGFIWTQLGAQSVSFTAFQETVSAGATARQPRLVTGLPSYQWSHARRHWYESRRSNKMRARKLPFHELLGVLSPDSTARDLRWNNVLKPSEIPWLEGHQLQGQTVFPAAGYVAMAVEASRHLVAGTKSTVELFELHDLTIPKAIAFDDDDSVGIETLVTLTAVRRDGPNNTIAADFSCYSCPSASTASASEQPDMDLMASGTVNVVLGTPRAAALSSAPAPDISNMADVDIDRFYSSLLQLGYGYTGQFRTMSTIKRRLNQSSVQVSTYPYDLDADESQTVYLVHPTMLDVAFQAAILAFSAPGDGRLWSLHVPTGIGRIRVNPQLCAAVPLSGSEVPVWSLATGGNGPREPFRASIDILGHDDDDSGRSMIQVEDLIVKPFAPATAADDRRLFSHTKWDVAVPDGVAVVQGVRPPESDIEVAIASERLAFYYIRKWKAELTDDEWANGQPHHLRLRDFVNHTLDMVASGQHQYVRQEWTSDTLEDIKPLMAGHPDSIDLKLISAVGENMTAAVRGETTILEHMLPNNMLDDFYEKGLGLVELNLFLAGMVKQITHRYPHCRILEIGAGTGSATKAVLKAIGNTFSSYTYTDISAGFFDKAADIFGAYRDKMTFKVLDVERSPASQGYDPHSYDIIIASNVLHATAVLRRTLENTRQLLRPGGYLMLAELTNIGRVRYGEVMGGLPGWWFGADDGRKYSPALTPHGWHSVLRNAGFSGVDSVTPELDANGTWPFSAMAAQAVDDRINLLRRPLLPTPSSSIIYLESVVILGTRSLESSRIAEELADHLHRFSGRVTILSGLPTEEEAQNLEPMSTFVNLVDLDSPIFKGMTASRMEELRRVFDLARHILWITNGATSADNPYHMASTTFMRAMSHEVSHVGIHSLDVADVGPDSKDAPKTIAEHLLRQAALEEWEREAPRITNRIPRHAFMWSKEPEAFVNKRGKLLVPRLMGNPSQNARLNSMRRVVARSVRLSTSPDVSIALRADAPPALVEQDPATGGHNNHKDKIGSSKKSASAQVRVRVEESSLMALNVAGDDFLFVGVGKKGADTNKGGDLVFLSTTNSSTTEAVASVSLAANQLPALVAVASELLAASVIETLSSGSCIVVHSAVPAKDYFFAIALKKRAETKGVRVTFVTSAADSSGLRLGLKWAKLEERTPSHVQKRTLQSPAKGRPTHFLDLASSSTSSDEGGGRSISARLLPANTKTIRLADLVRLEAQVANSSGPAQHQEEVLLSRLQDAVDHAASNATSWSSARSADAPAATSLVVPLNQIHQTKHHQITSAVRWQTDPYDAPVQLEARPLDAKRLFSADNSYLLVGLTGEIGRSVCEWMVANGAGCVCLASRTPKANSTWLQSFDGTASTVKLYAMDVADKASVARVVADIRATCPPIAGVANGAMVLRDSLFSSMTLDMMQDVTAPKIDGSNNLDDIFRSDPLDFFVLFSSSSAVIGNSGQANYAAANGYLNGLVRQRRKRGLAASAVDIGRVAGLGYVESAGQFVRDQLTRFGMMPISETEFHALFAETIQAGYPSPKAEEHVEDGVQSPEAVVTTGIRTIREDEELKGPWFENPFFSHSIIETRGGSTAAEGTSQLDKKKSLLPVREQLAAAATQEQALDMLRESFAGKLCSVLQISGEALDHDAPLVELGMDSLVAVEARSWFLKELKVDIPVLKLVGGSSLADICELALKKLPEEILGKIKTGGQSSPPPPTVPSSQPQLSSASNVPPKPPSTASTGSASRPREDSTTPSWRTPPPSDTPTSTTTQSSVSFAHKDASSPIASSASAGVVSETFVKAQPISLGQSRFWFLRLLIEDQKTFNVSFKYHMSGHVRVGDLEAALRAVAARHESLRTCFIGDEREVDQASQMILARSPIKLEYKKIQSAEEATTEYAKLQAHEFDLARGPLLQLVLLTLSPTSHYLLVNSHHIIIDMASFQVLLSEIEKVYNGQSLGPPPLQYPDFSVAQRQALERGELNDELEYWQSVFPAGEQPPILPLLPMARSSSRVAITEYAVHQASVKLEPALVSRIKTVSKAQRSTPFHFYLAAFKAMLFAFTDVQDLTIGIADANRNDGDVVGSIGFFVNLLTLRFRRQATQSFADAISEARNTAYGALAHSRLPFDVLLKELNVARSSSYSPFFQAFFDYRHQARGQSWCHCQFNLEELHPGRTGYDISLDVADAASGAHVALRVQKALYDSTAASLLLDTYVHFISILSRDTSQSLQDTPLFSDKQLAQAVQVGRAGPDLVSDWPETLPHRIDQVARENSDKTALMDGLGSSLTYLSMLNRIETIAEALIQAGTGPGSRVLVFQQASTDWVCSMLAIMRIGGVYVPLDLRNPLSRLAALSQDCQPGAILADGTTISDAPQLNVAIVLDVSRIRSAPSTRIANSADADSPAAILYTSGSTGAPKGIIIRHSGIRNEIEGYTKTYKLGAERVLQQSAFTFDFSVDQIFTGLVNGGMVYVVPWSKRGDPVSITEIIRTQSITYTKVTPSEYSMWMEYGLDNLRHASSWRFAFAGGEPLTDHVLRQFSSLGLGQLRLHNSYGPAEISIASHKGLVDYHKERSDEDGPVPCGFSLPNYTTYVLDEKFKPLPVGMPGEVVIGGAGVSLGYLTDKERTARVFVPNPFASPEYLAQGWTEMHRTGDVGHLQPDGSLVFRGRMAGDTQVKLRGLRIDLRDIETNMVATARGALKEAVVTLRKGDPDFLVAHVVFAPQHGIDDRDAFLEHLLSRLPIPQYMIPVLAVPLDKLPLTSHAKIDRKAIQELALPRRVAIDVQHDAELTETMAQLRQVWRQVLGKDSEELGLAITPSTSFFSVGGNSLLVVRLQSRIRQVFNVAVRLVELLNANTLSQMARKVEEANNVDLIDWELETSPPSTTPSFHHQGTQARANREGPKTVLVTGSTGNLAGSLVPLLLADPRVSKVHCVAVRPKVRSGRQQTLAHSDKIVYHSGDLSAPQLGLTEDEFQVLSSEVDVILHLGAVRSFWDNYHILRLSNVQSTKELIRLATPRQIPIHFVSTSSVLPTEVLCSPGAAQAALSAAAYAPPADGSDGYLASKWASERLLERSATTLVVPSFIYRLLPAAHVGREKQSNRDVLDEFVRCIDLAHVMPDYTGWEGRVSLVPAEQVARLLFDSAVVPSPGSDSAPAVAHFVHCKSPISLAVGELKAYLEEKRGDCGLEKLPMLKWMGRIKAVGFAFVLASLETTVRSGQRGVELTSRR